MQIFTQAVLLFSLNLIDALLTIFWVRNGYATEGNHLMAALLDIGNIPFLLVKIAIGALASVVLWKWSNFRLAKYGLALAVSLYVLLMGVHCITGLSAAGFLPERFVDNFRFLTSSVFAVFL
ncbi:MAG: hypothetical protein KIS76_17705 [Pyrinomonadaceae bacterium]|nr:hypothetical protein [Pyrinomonadaceae bacterium]